jgi:phosphonate transport system substrate-binding protein
MKNSAYRASPTLLLLLAFLVNLAQPAAVFAAEPGTYVIGVVPQHPPVAMHTNWAPFTDRLSADTGLAFTLKVYEKMIDFEADFKAGGPDFIFASPVQIVMARAAQGYTPLVRSSKRVAGILFVRKDSAIRSVRDLVGREIAFVGTKNL